MKDQENLRVFTTNRSIWRRKIAKWQLYKYHPKQRVCMDWVDKPKNYKDLYGILQLLRCSHLNNFPLKTLKPGWVAFHSVTVQLKCLDSQSNQYKKLVPVLSRFCNGLHVCVFKSSWLLSFVCSSSFHAHKKVGLSLRVVNCNTCYP